MDEESSKFLLITANVGSLFEKHGKTLQENWVSAFHELVEKQKPSFIALHFQELGGKTYNISNAQVKRFLEDLYAPDWFGDYTYIQNHVDKEFHETQKYTALGCSYFIKNSLKDKVHQWDFHLKRFVELPNIRSQDAILEDGQYIRKLKFPISCYSKQTTRLPRKGFTWRRWKINGQIITTLNIHLTHDASNMKITDKHDTKYAKYRRRSLLYAFEQLKDFENDDQHIIFGDFNVRLDTKALLEHVIGKETQREEICANGQPSTFIYRNLNGCSKVLLTIRERQFEFADYDEFDKFQNLLQFDKELNWVLENDYSEPPIGFRPTYPHKEDPEYTGSQSFSNARCPSWCDRIIVNKSLYRSLEKSECTYNTFGEDVTLGDHKPVYLSFIYGLQANR